MPVALIPILVAGGGIAYVASQTVVPKPTNTTPGGSPQGSASAFAPGQTVHGVVISGGKAAMLNSLAAAGTGRASVNGGTDYVSSPVVANASSAQVFPFAFGGDSAMGEKLSVINQYAEAAYGKLDAAARKKGADFLNDSLHLDPPIKEDAKWKDIAGAVGAAAGGAVGGYIGGPIGAKLGAMVGAYLGVKLEEFLSKHVDEIKDWFKSKWSDIEDWASGVASDAYDYVSGEVGGAVDDVEQWFSDHV